MWVKFDADADVECVMFETALCVIDKYFTSKNKCNVRNVVIPMRTTLVKWL